MNILELAGKAYFAFIVLGAVCGFGYGCYSALTGSNRLISVPVVFYTRARADLPPPFYPLMGGIF